MFKVSISLWLTFFLQKKNVEFLNVDTFYIYRTMDHQPVTMSTDTDIKFKTQFIPKHVN